MAVVEHVATPEEALAPAPRRRAIVVAAPLIAVVLGLAAGALLIAIAGANPIVAYGDMLEGAFGSTYAVGQLMTVSIPLLVIGLGLALAFRGRVYNIGAEGQLVMGALGSGAVAILVPIHIGIVLIPLSLLVGTAVGAAWALIVAVLRNRWAVNEVISSLLLTYVAMFAFFYVMREPLRDWENSTLTGKAVQEAARLPVVGSFSVHVGIFIAIALIPVVWYVMNRTPFGFRVTMLGFSPDATRTVGVSVDGLITRLMLISGGLAGLVGAIQVLGVDQRLDAAITSNYGFTAIVVALLGGLRVSGVVLAAIFLGALSVGGSFMSVSLALPYSVVYAIQGIFVIFLLLVTSLGRRA